MMNRRAFVVAGVGGALGAPMVAKAERRTSSRQDDVRGLFPRAEREGHLGEPSTRGTTSWNGGANV